MNQPTTDELQLDDEADMAHLLVAHRPDTPDPVAAMELQAAEDACKEEKEAESSPPSDEKKANDPDESSDDDDDKEDGVSQAIEKAEVTLENETSPNEADENEIFRTVLSKVTQPEDEESDEDAGRKQARDEKTDQEHAYSESRTGAPVLCMCIPERLRKTNGLPSIFGGAGCRIGIMESMVTSRTREAPNIDRDAYIPEEIKAAHLKDETYWAVVKVEHTVTIAVPMTNVIFLADMLKELYDKLSGQQGSIDVDPAIFDVMEMLARIPRAIMLFPKVIRWFFTNECPDYLDTDRFNQARQAIVSHISESEPIQITVYLRDLFESSLKYEPERNTRYAAFEREMVVLNELLPQVIDAFHNKRIQADRANRTKYFFQVFTGQDDFPLTEGYEGVFDINGAMMEEMTTPQLEELLEEYDAMGCDGADKIRYILSRRATKSLFNAMSGKPQGGGQTKKADDPFAAFAKKPKKAKTGAEGAAPDRASIFACLDGMADDGNSKKRAKTDAAARSRASLFACFDRMAGVSSKQRPKKDAPPPP